MISFNESIRFLIVLLNFNHNLWMNGMIITYGETQQKPDGQVTSFDILYVHKKIELTACMTFRDKFHN